MTGMYCEFAPAVIFLATAVASIHALFFLGLQRATTYTCLHSKM